MVSLQQGRHQFEEEGAVCQRGVVSGPTVRKPTLAPFTTLLPSAGTDTYTSIQTLMGQKKVSVLVSCPFSGVKFSPSLPLTLSFFYFKLHPRTVLGGKSVLIIR